MASSKIGFVVRTGGGLDEKVFGFFSDKCEPHEISDEDKAEGFTAEPASTLRRGRAKAKELNGHAEFRKNPPAFALVLVTEGSAEYDRLYKMYVDSFRKCNGWFTN